MNTLHEAHLADLEASGITRQTADEHGLCSISAQELAKLLGFSVDARTTGLEFPYPGKNGHCRVKLFPPIKTDKGSMKYVQAKGSPVRLFAPKLARQVLTDPTKPLFITEGEKKALKACQEGLPTLGIGGLWNWLEDGEPISDLDGIGWAKRDVKFVPDSDVWARPDLLRAVYAFSREMERRGARVEVLIIPQDGSDKVGLDDFLVSQGSEALEKVDRVPLKHNAFNQTKEWYQAWNQKRRPAGKNRGDANEEYNAVFPGLVDVVRLDDGTVGFMVVSQSGVDIVEQYELEGQTYVPPPERSMKWLLPRAKEVARHFKEDNDRDLYRDLVEYHKKISELPSEGHYHLLAIWDFHTYLFEQSEYSPYIWLYAVPERGKTRTGKGCMNVAWRGLHVESLRDAYLVRAAENLRCTLFFDVLSLWKKAQKHSTEDILLQRYEKGATVPRVLHPDKGPHEDTVYFDIFGPTIIATNETVGEILSTRAIQIIMPESDREFADDPRPEDGLELKERLTAVRGRNLNGTLPKADKPCRGRLGDILRPLRQVVRLVAPDEENRFLGLCKALQRERYEDLADTLEARIIRAITALGPEIEQGQVSAQAITDRLNDGVPERFQRKAATITRCCKRLGFRTHRPGGKTHVVIDPELLEKLATRYLGRTAQTALSAQVEEREQVAQCTSSLDRKALDPKCTNTPVKMHDVTPGNAGGCAECADSAGSQGVGRKEDQEREDFIV